MPVCCYPARQSTMNNSQYYSYLYVLLLCLLAPAGCTLQAQQQQQLEDQDGKIVNGTAAAKGEFPYIVSLRRAKVGSHSCGATLINSAWVLTAAHCVRGAKPEQLNLQYGSNIITRNTTQLAQIAVIYMHPGYEPQNKYINDIALLQLKTPVTMSSNVQPVHLPDPQQQTPANSTAVLIGWGLNATGGVVQAQLQKVQLKIFSDAECSQRHQTQLHDSQICAGMPEGGKGQCSGDSGGPLLHEGLQIGIVSWSIKPCARPPYPGVFTEVSAYVDWIVETLGTAVTDTTDPLTTQICIGNLIVGRKPPNLGEMNTM